MACSTRKSTELFLLDQPLEKFTDRQLPTGEEVLRRLYSFGCNSKSNREAVVTELVEVWGKARIPTMEIRSIKVKLESVVKKYEKLKINRKRSTDTQQAKEVHFKNELSRLFDISHKDALSSMKNKEDQAFLRDQRTERKMAMGGVDQELVRKETMRMKKLARKSEMAEKEKMAKAEKLATVDLSDSSSPSSGPSSQENSPFRGETSSQVSSSPKKRLKVTPEVVSALDRRNLSDRKATHLLQAVASSSGLTPASRSTLRRSRMMTRTALAEDIKTSFQEFINAEEPPLIVHWDDPIVVVKVEPEPSDVSPSQGETGAVDARCLHWISSDVHVKEELSEDSLSVDEKSTTILKTFSCTKNVHTFTERSLHQNQQSHCAKSKEYKHNCSHGQVKVKSDTCEKIPNCTECNKLFSCSSASQVHTNTHNVRNPNKSRRRNKESEQNSTCQLCLRTCTGETPFRCSVCKTFYRNKSTYENHKKTHAREKRHKCTICQKAFYRKSKYEEHWRTHTGEKPHQCSVCCKSFCRMSGLKAHMMTHTFTSANGDNIQREKPYKCSVCSKLFSYSSTLKNHKVIHTGEKPYKCSVCSRVFRHSSTLNKHKVTHTGEKPYKCSVCSRVFSLSSTLSKHKLTHTGEKPYKCPVCFKDFRLSITLSKHKLTHTGERPYECSVCSKAFRQVSTLKNHKQTHTGEKPYKCSVCSQDFRRLSTLNNHKLIHTGEKPYKCSVCSHDFRRLCLLNRHKVTHNRKTLTEKTRTKIRKMTKYQDFKEEVNMTWKLKKAEILPVIVGASGMINKTLTEYLKIIPGNITTNGLQVEAVRGSVKILKRALGPKL